jgi:peptide/nickel transport system substrate-binding protein
MRLLLALVALLVGSCAPSPAPSTAPQAAPLPHKPVVIALGNEPRTLEPTQIAGANGRDFSALTSGSLAYLTPGQGPKPMLAQELASLDAGTWTVLPDGRMETTYTLKRGPTWHDGIPITASDFEFTQRVRTDPLTGAESGVLERRMAQVRAADDSTLFIAWKEPYIWAGTLYGQFFTPLARHVLEPVYEGDKDGYLNSPLLREQFVGSGPYRLERWDPGAQLILRAHDGFALGKPLTDQLVIRFIPDGNTIVANLLSGAADVGFYIGLGFRQAEALEQGGWTGAIEYWRGNPRFLLFQMRDWGNLVPAVADVRVRRALVHAIDRQALVSLYNGKTQPLYYWMSPDDPSQPALDRSVPKYEYDPARAEALLREAGWAKGADGLVRNATGDALQIPMLNQSGDVELQEASVILNNWKAVGVTTELTNLTAAQDRDFELRSKFPAVAYDRRGIAYDMMVWTSASIASPQNRWGGQNRIGYVNPVLEENWTKAVGTVDAREREGYFVEAIKAMTADAVVDPTHLQPKPVAYRRGIVGPLEHAVGENGYVWNVWEWRWA